MREHETDLNVARKTGDLRPSRRQDAGEMGPGAQVDPLQGLATSAPGGPATEIRAWGLVNATGPRSAPAGRALLQLQRQLGNRYVQRVVALARQGDGEPEVSPEVESAIEMARSGGQPLDTVLRAKMESTFRSDFSAVRVHTGAEAHALNEAVNAVAFTTGNDIFFREGAYDPVTSGGRELLAHELTHVVQQDHSKLRSKLRVSEPGDQSEQEADQVARQVVSSLEKAGSASNVASAGPGTLPRQCACGPSEHGQCSECQKEESVQRTRFSDQTARESSLPGAPAEIQIPSSASSVDLPLSDIVSIPVDQNDQISDVVPGTPLAAIADINGDGGDGGDGSGGDGGGGGDGSGGGAAPATISCSQPLSMTKVTSGGFQSGVSGTLSMEKYYPDLAAGGFWQHGGSAGPFDTGSRVGSNIQLFGTVPSPCQPSQYTLGQTVTYTRAIFDGVHDPNEGSTRDDIAKSGRDATSAPFRQLFLGGGLNISMADPPSMSYGPGTNAEFDRSFVTSFIGPGGSQSVSWSTSIRIVNGTVTTNRIS